MNIRPLNAYEFAAIAPPKDKGVRGRVLTGEVNAPAVEVSTSFVYQSYFNDTLAEKAILPQPPSDPIVPSTLKRVDLAGYAVGLTPSSEAPVAIQFHTGQQQGASPVLRLKPGQVIRPFGRPGPDAAQFSGFSFGLPFGWLGGGTVSLILFRTSDAWVDWPGSLNEYVFHRLRLRILPTVPPLPTTPPYNWPLRFPWVQASSGSAALSQRGQPGFVVTPTRTLLRLRLDSLAAPETMRMLFCGTNDLAIGPDGLVNLNDVVAYDVVWGTWSQVGAGPGTQYQFQFLTDGPERLSADNGGVILTTNDANIAGQYVDIVRYGRL
jgi:hypothetical protein